MLLGKMYSLEGWRAICADDKQLNFLVGRALAGLTQSAGGTPIHWEPFKLVISAPYHDSISTRIVIRTLPRTPSKKGLKLC